MKLVPFQPLGSPVGYRVCQRGNGTEVGTVSEILDPKHFIVLWDDCGIPTRCRMDRLSFIGGAAAFPGLFVNTLVSIGVKPPLRDT